MIRLTAVLFALCLSVVPALADGPSAVTGSLAWQDTEALGRSYSVTANVDAAIGDLVTIGPALRVNYFGQEYGLDPNGGSLTLWSIGGTFTFYTTKSHNGLHVGVGALKPFDDATGYLVEPYVGLEFGGDSGFFRARFTHPLHYGTDGGDTVDLERDEVTAGFGLRFGK